MTKTQSLLEFAEKHQPKRPTLAYQIAPFVGEIAEARKARVQWSTIAKWLEEVHGIKITEKHLATTVSRLSK